MKTVIDIRNQFLEKFNYIQERESLDWPAFNVPYDKLLSMAKQMKEELGYSMCMDVTVVDWDTQSPRFSAVYHTYNPTKHMYIRLVTDCKNDGDPVAPSVSEIWPAADWHEREAYDMFGVKFQGHKDLRRILMWDDYPYYPLRKEFPLAGIETEFPAADVAAETKAKVEPAPMMGGPFHANPEGHTMAKREPRAADQSWSEEQPKRETTI